MRPVSFPQLQPLTYRHGEDDIYQVLADDGGQHARTWSDDVALRHRCAPDLASHRRADQGVVEIDLRGLGLGLRDLHLGFEAALVRNRRVVDGLLPGRASEQGPRAFGRQLGIFKRRLELRHLRLFRCEIRFERTALKPIELIACVDLGALLEQAPFQKCGDARNDIDSIDRLDPPEKFTAVGDRSPCRFHDADRWWPRRGRLGPGHPAGDSRQESCRQQPDRDASKVHCPLLATGLETEPVLQWRLVTPAVFDRCARARRNPCGGYRTSVRAGRSRTPASGLQPLPG